MKEIETCGEENVKTKKISNLLEASYDPDIKIKEEATPIEKLEHEESIIKDETDSKKDDTSAKYYSFVNNDVCIIILLLIVIYSRIGYNTFINSMFYINILYHIFIDSRSIRYFHNAFSRRRLFLRFSL